MIVADTNLLVHLHVPTRLTPDADAVFRRDSQWVSPWLWRSEFRNALAGLIRQGTLTTDLAVEIADRAEMWMQGQEYTVATEPVLRLASSSGCSAYDCEFVVLAQTLDITFVTADRQVLIAFPAIAVHPATFAA